MNESSLIDTLHAALANHAPQGNPPPAIRTAIQGDPDLRMFDNQLHYAVFGWMRATFDGLAYWLYRRSAETSPQTAVGDLARYVTSPTITCTHIMTLGGIRVTGEITVTPDIKLLPFADITRYFWAARVRDLYQGFHENYRPTAALLERQEYAKAVASPDGPLGNPPDLYGRLDDVRRCMTALGPSSPVWLGTWTELDEWVPTYGSGAAIPLPFETGGFPREVLGPDWADLPSLYLAWTKLSAGERQHLRVPLDRLGRSLRNVPLVDAAIELGVAIDALFLAEREADRGEQTLTLRLRASRFLGGSTGERRELARFFGILYRARSMAVHAGRLDDRTDGVPTRALLQRGADLTAAALRRIIIDGEPDWTELLYA